MFRMSKLNKGKMEATEEFNRTHDRTDKLATGLTNYLQEQKGGEWKWIYQPDFGPTDYGIYKNNKLQFYVEIKTRRHKKGTYDQEKVPMSKVGFAYLSEEVFKVKAYYLIEWAEEEVGIINLKDYDCFKVQVARYDRGEETDWYAMYDHKNFKIINLL